MIKKLNKLIMESKNTCITGVIKGMQKDLNLLQEYMQSTINTIKAQIKEDFPEKNKYLYIYYKYNAQKRIFNIFIIIFKNEYTIFARKDITYLITVGEEYPKSAPKVFCLTNLNEKIDIFDMKNIQKNLVEQWKPNNTVCDLINELLKFADSIVFQVENKLFPYIGEYHYNSYLYDLNDFLLNPNNIFFRVYYFSSQDHHNDISKNERFMIITKNAIIFLAYKNSKFKNQCVIEFRFELTWIEALKRFPLNKYPNYVFFEFVWNNHSNYLHKFVFGIKGDNTKANKIYELIINRKKFLFSNFKYFEKLSDNDVETLEKIIFIKEKYLELSFTKNIYYQIHKLYRNIINIFNSMNDEGYKKYVEKLQTFITKFEKAKKMNIKYIEK